VRDGVAWHGDRRCTKAETGDPVTANHDCQSDDRRNDGQADVFAFLEFHGLFLAAYMAIRLARIGARHGDASDADEAVVRAQERYGLGNIDGPTVEASGTSDATLRRARRLVA
jgi:predicted kinase